MVAVIIGFFGGIQTLHKAHQIFTRCSYCFDKMTLETKNQARRNSYDDVQRSRHGVLGDERRLDAFSSHVFDCGDCDCICESEGVDTEQFIIGNGDSVVATSLTCGMTRLRETFA